MISRTLATSDYCSTLWTGSEVYHAKRGTGVSPVPEIKQRLFLEAQRDFKKDRIDEIFLRFGADLPDAINIARDNSFAIIGM